MKRMIFALMTLVVFSALAKETFHDPFLTSVELGLLRKDSRQQYLNEIAKKGHPPDPELNLCLKKQAFTLCRLSYALYVHSAMQECKPTKCKAEAALSKDFRKKISKESK